MTTATARTFIYGTSHSSISTPARTGVASTLMSSLAVGGLQTSSQFGHLRLLSGRTSSIVCANRFVAHRDGDERLPELPLLATLLALATDTEPMRGLQRRALERARLAGLDRITVAGGVAYSDVRRAGVSTLIVHCRGSEHVARDVPDETARDIESIADRFTLRRDDPATAVARAMTSSRRPVVPADNVGGQR